MKNQTPKKVMTECGVAVEQNHREQWGWREWAATIYLITLTVMFVSFLVYLF